MIKKIAKAPILRELVRIFFRLKRAYQYTGPQVVLAIKWSLKKTEISNYYYGLTAMNRADLANVIGAITDLPVNVIEGYFEEIEQDEEVGQILQSFKLDNPYLSDSTMGLGRRIGWYAIARAVKPRVIVETGVHHGVGALVLRCALQRNLTDGFVGEYIGTDIDQNAGILVSNYATSLGKIQYGDSITTLKTLPKSCVDLFINDSDHSFEYERKEYDVVKQIASPSCIILGDNSHISPELRDFSRVTNRNFIFFKEIPFEHFYPGAGLGISFPKS